MSNAPEERDEWRDDLAESTNEGAAEPDIQEILDLGYQQLDEFVEWLERVLKLDPRSAQQDCFNAESLLDYLANHQHKSALDIDEFSLRWFVFSHYIRKTIADRETQERLTDSLLRFFLYLQARDHMILPDWIPLTLEDNFFYLERLRTFRALDSEDEAEWKLGFRLWCDELEQDLDTRGLWLPQDMGEGMEWADQTGWREATLRDEANRLWQSERTALLEDGLSMDAVRDRLVASYHLWMDTPQSRLDGQTPREVIRQERLEQRLGDEPDDGMVDEM